MQGKEPIEYRMSNIGNELNQIVLVKTDTPELRTQLTEPHLVDGMSIVVCLKGTMRLKINFKEHYLERSKMLLTFPNSLIEPLEVSDDLVLCSTLYNIDYISSIPISSNFDVLYRLNNMPCVSLTEKELHTLEGYFNFMFEKYNDPHLPNKGEVLKFLLASLRIEVRSVYANIDADEILLTRTEQVTRDFLALLYSNFRKERNVAFYAEKLHLTPKYLTTLVREHTGYSILTWIHQAVVSTAKLMLKSSEKTVLEIADELNFVDSSIFCRFFKQQTGMTPVQFRKTE